MVYRRAYIQVVESTLTRRAVEPTGAIDNQEDGAVPDSVQQLWTEVAMRPDGLVIEEHRRCAESIAQHLVHQSARYSNGGGCPK